MDLIPVFEIGVWNAWILLVSFLLLSLPIAFIKKDTLIKIDTGCDSLTRTEKIVSRTAFILLPFTLIYSLFLPLKLNTLWFFIGLPICLIGLIILLIASINFATTSVENEPVTKGMYRFSRNPTYFGSFIVYLGIGITCASWIFLLCALMWIILLHIYLPREEQDLINFYGDAYREYMKITPKWIGIPKSRKKG
ncbi:MAG: methyltransferase family protein [Candidatus Heimdallarchaeaceae archaeon]